MRLDRFLSLLTSSVVLSLPLSQAFSFKTAGASLGLVNGMAYPARWILLVLTCFPGRDSVQATFIVPSVDADNHQQSFVCDYPPIVHRSVPDPPSQELTFQLFATNSSCGTSNFTLNGIPLTQDWDSTGLHAQGVASIPTVDRALDVWWYSDCLAKSGLDVDRGNASQLLTLTIEKIDSREILSLSGFTISFKQTNQPQLLRLSTFPDYSAISPPQASSWRDPPSALHLNNTVQTSNLSLSAIEESPAVSPNSSLPELIEELRLLEAEAEALYELIQLKHDYIHTAVHKEAEILKEEIHQCDGWICALKAIWRKAHGVANLVYLKLRPNPHRDEVRTKNSYWRVIGGQQPTVMKMSFSEGVERGYPLPQPPPRSHCADGQPGRSVDEKQPFPDELPPRPPPRARQPPFFVVLIKTILIITGIAAIFSFIRRRFCSLRNRTDRAAAREQRRTERAYRRQARRQAFRDWWYGRRRGTPGLRPGDYEEKHDLIRQQEGILEEAMQDEIRQLQVQEEIRQLRQTHTTVEQLVRAEEGRSRQYLQQDLHQTVATSSTHPHGFVPIPIPSRSTGSSSHGYPPTPRSRSSSLPDYTSESGMSNPPPSYKSRASAASQGEETDEDTEDVTSDYTPSATSSQWTPGSSIPDISPRPSIETARTFL